MKLRFSHCFLFAILLVSQVPSWGQVTPDTGLVKEEFIFQNVPFRECHASTIAELNDGSGTLAAAWFGGMREGMPDVGIWVSTCERGKSWTFPVEVVNGKLPDGTQVPCWNPVLFQPKTGDLTLYFKVGPSPSTWRGECVTSRDGGKTWENRRKLPDGFLGPIKNKPVQLDDGTVLCPTSSEAGGEWKIYFEFTDSDAKSWERTDFIHTKAECQGIQPTLLRLQDGKLRMLARNRGGNILTATSDDGGRTWSPVVPTDLPNPNSGIDAVTLSDGRHVLVYNPTRPGLNSRATLSIALRSDDGSTWQNIIQLESTPGVEYSYPAVIQTSDGLVHITYTWRRSLVKHLVFDPTKWQ